MKLDMVEQTAVAAAAAAVAAETVANAAAAARPSLTMYTSHLYSPQEVYNFIVTRVIQQGRPAISDVGQCVLLDMRGNRCAVGMLVPGHDGFMRSSVDMPRHQRAVPHWALLVALRGAHDDAAAEDRRVFLQCFRKNAVFVARNFRLNPAVALLLASLGQPRCW